MERKLRVALMTYAIDNRPNKGTALYARKLTERLIADPDLTLYFVHYDPVRDPLYENGVEIRMPRIRLPYGSRFVSQLLFYWKYRNDPFDIIHWFQPRLYPFFWLAPARKLVVTAHGAGDITAPSKFVLSKSIFNWLFKRFNKHLDAIIGVSEFARQEIIEWYQTDPSATHAILLGGAEDFPPADMGASKDILAGYGITRPYILTVSRHVPHKNIGRLIQAYTRLRAENSSRNELLVVVGSRSLAYSDNFKEKEASSYRDDIRFIEFVPQEHLPTFYAAASLMAFVSLNEGFGLPLIEAFVSKVPVVSSTITSLPEIAGDAAILVDPYDIDAIAGALKSVLSDSELRASLIRAGERRVSKFSWERMARETVRLYRSLGA